MKKNFLNGWEIPSFAALAPAAIQWRDTVANVRVHGETHRQPLDLFAQEKPRLKPLPAMLYDCVVVRPISANGCCHILYDTNRYSVPHRYASQKLTLKCPANNVSLVPLIKIMSARSADWLANPGWTGAAHTGLPF